MYLATLLRYVKIAGEDVWADRYYIVEAHRRMAQQLGVGLSAIMNDHDLDGICSHCSALLVPGSATNIDPSYYGQKPLDPPEPADEYALDSKVIRWFFEHEKPILGVCGGLQAINVFLGGTLKLVPDVKDVHERMVPTVRQNGEIVDYPMHEIQIEKDSFVYDVFGAERASVCSYHYWCIDKLAPGLRAVAWSDDGIIEAVEWKERSIFATQWHPELSFDLGDPVEHKFFENFLRCCREQGKQG